MVNHWWDRLFGEDGITDDSDTQSEQRSAAERPFSLPIGHFEDQYKRASVKMVTHYAQRIEDGRLEQAENKPRHQQPAKTLDKGSGLKTASASHTVEKPVNKSKRPFRLTQIPSPVFGFRKPPENFYRRSNSDRYSSVQSEPLDKQKIREAQTRRSAPSVHSGEARPAKVLDQPAIERLTAHQEQSAARQTETPASITADSQLTSDNQRPATREQTQPQPKQPKQEENKDWLMPVTSHLPRAVHRPTGSSNIPFNVLMFHSDKGRSREIIEKKSQPVIHKAADRQPNGLQLSLDLLDDPPENNGNEAQWIADKQAVLSETLADFHVHADIIGFVQGPSVTRFDIHLHPGVKMSKIVNLTDDIKLSLAVKQIRIAPVSGRSAVGIEIPNQQSQPVVLKEMIRSKAFSDSRAALSAALGEDVSGNQVVTDLSKMPHGLIAGATGSGKSVCIHSLIISLIYRTRPEDLRFLLVDPKVVELAPYAHLPHLAAPVLTEPREAALALKWAVEEMEKRYRRFAGCGVRDIQGYNKRQAEIGADENHLPYLIIIIDELADLMMVAPQDVEESVCRIAQKARAAGIHLLLATQRPSVDVITGLIKSNIPTRIAFSVSSQTDSRTILDSGGAERLLGRGDMLFMESGTQGLKRLQGCYVSDEEIQRVAQAFAQVAQPDYLFTPDSFQPAGSDTEDSDELFLDAAAFVVAQGQASVSSIQRHFRIGYPRAARLVDELENRHVISGANGSKPRQVLASEEDLDDFFANDRS
ncbi:MAG: DNA translocase FtsK [Sporolactobacillus sp.]